MGQQLHGLGASFVAENIGSASGCRLRNRALGLRLIVMLFHNMNNTFSSGFVGQMFSGAAVNQAWLRLTLWGVVAIVLVVVYGSQNLSRKH